MKKTGLVAKIAAIGCASVVAVGCFGYGLAAAGGSSSPFGGTASSAPAAEVLVSNVSDTSVGSVLSQPSSRDITQGVQAVEAEKEAARIAAEGHETGTHGDTHSYFTSMSRAEVCRDLSEARRKLMEATGRAPTLLRPPGGLYDAAVLQQTACADLPVILWSVDPEDWRVHDADAVTAHILRHAEPGSVILMHDLTDSSVPAALRVIDALQAQGYEFLTVSELAARSGTALTPGQAYCSFPP